MKRRKAALLAGMVATWSVMGPDLAWPFQAGPSPALAQRAPLYGVWTGGMQCGRYVRIMQLFMYGNGTGLLLLGISPFTPDVKPAVAMVSLRQPPDNDYVLIDRWISNAEPPPQLVGRLGADGIFEGKVLGDARCTDLLLRPYNYPAVALQNMARVPLAAAQQEARKLDPPQMTAKDMIVMGIFAYAILGGIGGGSSGGGGGGGGGGWSPPPPNDSNAPLPSVGGNVHGNFDTDIHGNETQDLHGNTLRPRGY